MTNVIYCAYGTADEQCWNTIDTKIEQVHAIESGMKEKEKYAIKK